MPQYLQADRPLTVTSPLGKDDLLLVGFSGQEAISHLFTFQLDLLAENSTEVPFEKLLGQSITVNLTVADGKTKRYFNGICNRVSQGGRDSNFTTYRLEIVPHLWLLTKKAQSRIFQHMSVLEILKKVLEGLDVAYEIQGDFQPRDFCVQYRETDFNFACRLMEEEGIYYFFKHAAGKHTMVLANTPQSHSDVPYLAKIIFEGIEGGKWDEDRVHEWEKLQELRSGKYTLWDHTFELPHKHLEAEKTIQDSVAVGKVTHKLKVGNNDKLELYDFPGEYAQRFDGVDKGGGDQPAELQKISPDSQRTVGLRMQEEAVPSLVIQGTGTCRQFTAGHKFTLDRHFNANGQYVLTSVNHSATLNTYRSAGAEFSYHNSFTCIPLALPCRPLRTTPKPFVQGTQTAVVAGPPGEEIFTDKYGRVKVQFHWDREGKNDANSSCWVRVSSLWAGKQWGVIHIPRIGQEVIVDFLEGDPDQPIITGSVYNADQMPPYKLPDHKTQSGIKSRSSLTGTESNFNEFRFEDKKGSEQVFLHAEKNQDIEVEKDESHWVGHDRTKTIDHDETVKVKHDRTETVDNNETITIGGNRNENVKKDEFIAVSGNRTRNVDKDEDISIKGKRTEEVGKDEEVKVGKNRDHTVGENDQLNVGKQMFVTVGDEIVLKTGDASITMQKDGTIQIKGKDISLVASGKINGKASSDVTLKGANIKAN